MERNYIENYRAADDAVKESESKVEQYTALVEDKKWERARIAFEAVESGGFSQSSFAREVGVNQSTISRQVKVWRTYAAPHNRPSSYTEAWATVENDNRPAAGSTERAKETVTRLPAAERAEVVKQAMADPEVAREVVRDRSTIDKITTARVENLKDEPRGDTREAGEAVEKARKAIKEHSLFADMARLRTSIAAVSQGGADLNPEVVASEVALTRNALDLLESLVAFDGDWDSSLASIDGGTA